MTTVTGLTADRMLAIEAASVIDGDVVSGNLILTKHDGSTINAGSVIGPAGPQGPPGSMTSVVASRPILDVGLANQIRAGRQLSPADFAAIGLNAPIALWNLSDSSDSSGNGRNLNNKGAVPFASGINGVANTAAQFAGLATQAFYISDSGAADPFRIKFGTWGCWFRTAKRGTLQRLMNKWNTSGGGGDVNWAIHVDQNNMAVSSANANGTVYSAAGFTDVADDRWHFLCASADGTMARIFVDGILEATGQALGYLLQNTPGPVNIGSFGADASTGAAQSFWGRIDEAFITSDILSEDQVYNLYCASVPHSLAVVPTRVSLNVRRRRKGAALVASDFPTQPLRLHNFSAGSLGDEGSNNTALTSNPGSGFIGSTPGADGSNNNAYAFSGAHTGLSSTDAGLPSGVATRSYGCWFKVPGAIGSTFQTIMSWGIISTGESRLDMIYSPAGQIRCINNGDVIYSSVLSDGLWHFIVSSEDSAALDGAKRKFYVDGKLVAISATFAATTPGGANSFRIGANPNGTQPWTGQIDCVFVCGYALTPDQIRVLYAKGSQVLSPSPKNVGDHVEGMDAANLYVAFDTLDSQYQVDLGVSP
jgi:hypothetical protein